MKIVNKNYKQIFSEFHRSNWWLPLKWSIEVITSAREGELISNPPGLEQTRLFDKDYLEAKTKLPLHPSSTTNILFSELLQDI